MAALLCSNIFKNIKLSKKQPICVINKVLLICNNCLSNNIGIISKNFSNRQHVFLRRLLPKNTRTLINVNDMTIRHNSRQQTTEQNRKRVLTYATYFSCAIGVMLISLIAVKEYKKLRRRARGVEQIEEPLLGRRKYIYKYRGYIYPDFIADNTDNIYHFKVREDDVWIITHPKAGTTWMEEIVFLILTDLDFQTATSKTLEDRVPYFEFVYPGFKQLDQIESQRIIKSHLPMSFLPKQMKDKKPKIVYVARNAKDTVISYYHFYKMVTVANFNGNLDDFVNRFVDGKCFYSPWWKHVIEAWKMKDEENVLFVKYEDMKKNISSVIQQVALFLDKPLTEKEINIIAEYTKFENMKNNPNTNYSWWRGWGFKEGQEDFLRKGEVGDWKNHLSPEQTKKIEEVVETNLRDTGLVFDETNVKDDK